ncbi:MAG TPA: FAD/NAD(P)-binding protein [Xanthomonadales bacterium]|nr:FAD/NAD(P)-binding protein [Xanthomonadales bacterium]
MKKSDDLLGMKRDITRRDFIHDVGLGAIALGLPGSLWSAGMPPPPAGAYYPPTLTGMRGSHPGAFEVAHALVREGKQFDSGKLLDENYDLVVVGAGISGLAAAYFFRQQHGPDSRILILDNHDDFGGHAKRNEFHQGGPMRLAWGGTVNMEYPYYSDVAKGLVNELGIDIPRLLENFQFDFSTKSYGLGTATFFDAAHYGDDVLVKGIEFRNSDLQRLAEQCERFPISAEGRAALKAYLGTETDVLAGMSDAERLAYLESTSFPDFLRQHFQMPEDAIQLFRNGPSGFMGLKAEYNSVAECIAVGLPVSHVLGDQGKRDPGERHSPVAMFPDGNSSIARLLVRALIPEAFPDMSADADAHSIVTQRLDYSKLDQAGSKIRLRLNSTVVHAANQPPQEPGQPFVALSYVNNGEILQVHGDRAVMACYNNIIRYLVPELPEAQKVALAKCVKRPLMVVNVVLKNGLALESTGVGSAYLPGSYLEHMQLVTGVNVADYHPEWRAEDACVMQFYAGLGIEVPKGTSVADMTRLTRMWLLEQSFEDFEREIRSVLNGIYSPAGFNAADDILAITVNRWPHGYARDHVDLEDADWNTEPAPNVVGRQPCGRIAIANSDAGADAYTHIAIDQAWRAVQELPGA